MKYPVGFRERCPEDIGHVPRFDRSLYFHRKKFDAGLNSLIMGKDKSGTLFL